MNLIFHKLQKLFSKVTDIFGSPVGTIMYEGLLTLRRAESLRLNFQALDALNETVPAEELDKMMETLIPDEALRKLLRAKH